MSSRSILPRLLPAGPLALGLLAATGCTTTAGLHTPRAQTFLGNTAVPGETDAGDVSPMTGRIMSDADLRTLLPGAILGDKSYAEVNSAWLARWYPIFRSRLFKIGLTQWNARFDCNRFADFYANLAQAFFAVEMFHSNTQVDALALGPVWYRRDYNRGAHAVIQAVTERGRIFIDPQTGAEIQLSPAERRSCFVQLL